MKTMHISYDLHTPGRDYKPLYDYFRSQSTWAHPLESVWLVRTHKTCSEVRDDLNRLTDSNDEVMVVDVTGDNWATTFKDDTTDWMHTNMKVDAFS